MNEPMLTNCDANCAWCGMNHLCTASPYSMDKMRLYYEITRRNNNERKLLEKDIPQGI